MFDADAHLNMQLCILEVGFILSCGSFMLLLLLVRSSKCVGSYQFSFIAFINRRLKLIKLHGKDNY